MKRWMDERMKGNHRGNLPVVAGLLWAAAGLGTGCGTDAKTEPTDAAVADDTNTTDTGVADDTATSDGASTDVAADTGKQTIPAPTGGSADLTSGKAGLRLDRDAKLLSLTFDAKPRTQMDLSRLRFGQVATWNAEWNYSPDDLVSNGPDGLTWFHVTTVAWQPHELDGGTTGVSLLLHTADDAQKAGPDYVLAVEPRDVGFRSTLKLADTALAARVATDTQPTDTPVYVGLRTQVGKTERFYGLGEYFDTPQHRGHVRHMQIVLDTTIDAGYNEAHVPIPLVIGTGGWGLFVEDRHTGIFDVAANKDDEVEALFAHHETTFWLFAAAQAMEVTGLYTKVTGAPVLPAKWALGTLIWRNENKDQAEVLADMQAIRDNNLAISGMWLDRPFDVAVNDFGFDSKKFSDPKAMVDKIHAQGFRMGEWSTPYLDPGPKNPKAQKQEEAVAKGFFVDSPLGNMESSLSQWGAPLDLTNPDALAFWKAEIKKATDAGVEGWKLDYGEDIQAGILSSRTNFKFWDGSDERTMHHGYHLFYHRPYAESLPTTGGWLLSRAGTYGDQVYSSVIWPGDLCANWAHHRACDEDGLECHTGGLPASVAAGISLPASGYPIFGPDTGGYKHGRPSKELFLRWLGHSAFLGMLQIGGGSQANPWDFAEYKGNKYAPGGISQFDQETLDTARTYISLHTRLFPYIYTYLTAAHNHKPGLIRGLGLAYPDLNNHTKIADFEASEYLFGEDLLVAPITQPGGKRQVLIPPGEWVDWWTKLPVGLPNAATIVDVDLPITQTPLYVRAGGILTMLRPTIDTLSPSTDPTVDSFDGKPGRLYAMLAPGNQATSRTLYDGSVVGWDWTPTNAIGVELTSTAGSDFKTEIEWTLTMGTMGAPYSVQAKNGTAAVTMIEAADETAFATCANCWIGPQGGGSVRLRTSIGTTVTVKL